MQNGSFGMLLAFILSLSPFLQGETLTRVANTSLSFPEATPLDGSYAIENAFDTTLFSSPIALATPQGETTHTFVVERSGQIQRVNLSDNSKALFLDLKTWVDSIAAHKFNTDSESGLLSMAFHPDYKNNGYFYIFYSVEIEDQLHQRVARMTATGTAGNYLDAVSTDPSTHQALITQYDEAGNHNGGDLHFGNDGYLYISVGDEGGAGDSYNNSNFINKNFFSAILRIDIDKKSSNFEPNLHTQTESTSHPSAVNPGTYKIPDDNPFLGASSHQGITIDPASVRTEIWVTGLRNPFRFSFDKATGRCFVGDVGQDEEEEINLVFGGEDCGWSRREGSSAYTNGPAGTDVPAGYSPHEPIYDYDHSGDPKSVTGGLIYRGSRLGELFGRYIFSDFITGQVWQLEQRSNGRWTRRSLFEQVGIASFGEDPATRDLLFCVNSDNFVGRLVRTSTSIPAPLTLSATGAFSDLATLTPQPGIFAYDVNQPFWSDHAKKRRWFSMPDADSKVGYSENENWAFPTGQVWIKHFDLEIERGNPASLRPLETRFTVKTAEGIYGLSYRWRPDGKDADLVGSAGIDEDLSLKDDEGISFTQTWSYPSRSECLICHTQRAGYALSFNVPQLNRSGSLGINQLSCLSDAGFFDGTPSPTRGLPAHPAISDDSVSLEARVRSYLAINCVMCHSGPGGAFVPARFDARIDTQTDLTEMINGMLFNDLGDPLNRFLVPGDLAHSVVVKRLDGTENRMPPLASNVIDQEAIDLISAWITEELPNRQTYDQWALASFGVTGTSETAEEGDFDQDGQSNLSEFNTRTNAADPDSRFALEIDQDGVTYTQPANRHFLIERSSNLVDWFPVESPDNSLLPLASPSEKSYLFPDLQPKYFLRAKVSRP